MRAVLKISKIILVMAIVGAMAFLLLIGLPSGTTEEVADGATTEVTEEVAA